MNICMVKGCRGRGEEYRPMCDEHWRSLPEYKREEISEKVGAVKAAQGAIRVWSDTFSKAVWYLEAGGAVKKSG